MIAASGIADGGRWDMGVASHYVTTRIAAFHARSPDFSQTSERESAAGVEVLRRSMNDPPAGGAHTIVQKSHTLRYDRSR